MSELRHDLFLVGALLVVAAAIGGASFYAYRADERRRVRLTAEVPAEILEVYVSRSRNTEGAEPGPINNVRISYRYEIDGRSFTRVTTLGRNVGLEFKVGSPAKVCYNPNDPQEAELFQVNRQCGT